jgi:pimeloyl-ACP methyl ester carboxylesterase
LTYKADSTISFLRKSNALSFEWSTGGNYGHLDGIYDIAQLVHQENLNPVHIISHSLGGTLASLFAGIYPEKIASLTIIEGVGGLHHWFQDDEKVKNKIKNWIRDTRNLAGRSSRKYPTMETAFSRMQKSNPHLDYKQARHLTIHGSNRNEDGTFSWKFDNYTHARALYDLPWEDMTDLWQEITCPVLIITGSEGYPFRIGQNETDKYFSNLKSTVIKDAGHWVHHDQTDEILSVVTEFLGSLPD